MANYPVLVFLTDFKFWDISMKNKKKPGTDKTLKKESINPAIFL